MKDGLSHDAALSLTQDKKGFLWIGTYAGLNKFDGYSFTAYLENQLDSNGLVSNSVNSLWADEYNRLWVGTPSGLQLFDLATERFFDLEVDSGVRFHMQTNRFRQRKDGKLWLCTSQGIYLADPQTLSITSFIDSGHDENSNIYFDIAESDDGTIWAASEEGLVHLNIGTGEVMRYLHSATDPRSLASNIVKSVYIDTNNRVWAGTQQGLDLFNFKDQTFTHFPFDQNGKSKVEVQTIVENPDGKLWLGSTHGLDVFDPITLKFELLVDQFVWSIFEDRQKIRWLGTAHGLYQISPPGKKFNIIRQFGRVPVADARVFAADQNGHVWIAVYNPAYKLFRYDPSLERFFEYVHDPSNPYSFSGNSIRAIIPEKGGGLWITSYFKLQKFDFGTQTFSSIDLTFEPTAMIKDSNGALWLGGWTGIGIFDLSTITFKPLSDFPRIEVKSIVEDRYQNIWIATIDGLFRYGLNTGKLETFKHDPTNAHSISHDRVHHMMIDAEGIIWLGTSRGINKMLQGTEKSEPKFIHWGTANSKLPHDEVWCVIDGGDGTLWMSCGNRISHFFPKSDAIRNYDHSDGLHGQSIYGGLRSERGEICFSSRDGLIVFHPDSLKDNWYSPPVTLTNFSLYNRQVPRKGSFADTLSWKTPLLKVIPYTEEIALTYEQNDVSFEFASLNYVQQEKNQYKYKLEPYEMNWIEASAGNRIARYTNLSPGRYTFRVIGSNNDGLWNEYGAKLTIIITPPWWQTWWAYSLYAIVVACVLLFARLSIIQRERLKSKLKLEHLELEKVQEIDTLKSNFFANISHEFRTPVTLILGPLKEMYNGTFSSDHQATLGVMIRNGQRLLRLINQLLDLSKLEVGKMLIHAAPIDLVLLLREAASSYESLGEDKKINFFFFSEVQELTVNADQEKIEKVVHNLLSNAFKFTPEGGEVILNLGIYDQHWAAITVKDTGIGIPANELDKIFDRFYQVDCSHTRQYEGSGLGMTLARELVLLHHGKITVESTEGKGSSFTVLLPLEQVPPKNVEATDVSKRHKIYSENLLSTESLLMRENEIEPNIIGDGLKSIVLIVEDNSDMRQYIRRILSARYETAEVENGREGLKKAIELIPDLIISDIMMPEMDGYKLCETIKTKELTSHIPVILLTAKADRGSKIAGLETGADDYLAKPFDADELRLIVRNRIEARNKMKERFSREVTLEPRHISVTSFDEKFVNRLLALIEDKMDNENFSIEELSREIGYSNTHLYRKIKALTGQTPSQFLRTIRLKRAAELLCKKSDNISQIAYSVGFTNLSYFNKCFKEQFGQTPGQFASAH